MSESFEDYVHVQDAEKDTYIYLIERGVETNLCFVNLENLLPPNMTFLRAVLTHGSENHSIFPNIEVIQEQTSIETGTGSRRPSLSLCRSTSIWAFR